VRSFATVPARSRDGYDIVQTSFEKSATLFKLLVKDFREVFTPSPRRFLSVFEISLDSPSHAPLTVNRRYTHGDPTMSFLFYIRDITSVAPPPLSGFVVGDAGAMYGWTFNRATEQFVDGEGAYPLIGTFGTTNVSSTSVGGVHGYVGTNTSAGWTRLVRNSETGSVSVVGGGTPTPANYTSGIAVHPSGNWVIMSAYASPFLSLYSRNSETGALTYVRGLPVTSGVNFRGTECKWIDGGTRFILVHQANGSGVGVVQGSFDPVAGTFSNIVTANGVSIFHYVVGDAGHGLVVAGSGTNTIYSYGYSDGAFVGSPTLVASFPPAGIKILDSETIVFANNTSQGNLLDVRKRSGGVWSSVQTVTAPISASNVGGGKMAVSSDGQYLFVPTVGTTGTRSALHCYKINLGGPASGTLTYVDSVAPYTAAGQSGVISQSMRSVALW
jgi:hypothetical protein